MGIKNSRAFDDSEDDSNWTSNEDVVGQGSPKKRPPTDLAVAGAYVRPSRVVSKGGSPVHLEMHSVAQLGQGSFGKIFKMRAARSGRPSEFVALKRPECIDCDDLEKNVLR